MSVATITSKGQVTLPKDVRDKLHLKAGEKIDFRVDENSESAIIIPLNKSVDDVFAILSLKKTGKSISSDQMDAAIKEKLKKEYL